MTDKLERLARIEAEAAALRKLIEAEKVETKQVKTPCFTPNGREKYWQLTHSAGENHLGTIWFQSIRTPKAAFRDEATAKAYAEAFNVMIELRLYADGGDYFIYVNEAQAVRPYDVSYKYSNSHAFGGRYSSEAQAQKAIDAVGEDRIIQAIKTLCWVL